MIKYDIKVWRNFYFALSASHTQWFDVNYKDIKDKLISSFYDND